MSQTPFAVQGSRQPVEPVVILGGFLSHGGMYRKLQEALAAYTGRMVVVAGVHTFDWMATVARAGWLLPLEALGHAVQQAVRRSAAGKVTLVAHSAGGVLARLYLSPQPFLGRVYAGMEHVDHLITLGSPHNNRGGLMRGGRMSQWVNARYPGAHFAPQVRYISVAGKAVRGMRDGSPAERWAYQRYRELCGDGETWGDGLIPVESALLIGSEPVVLPGVQHYSTAGLLWYGSPEALPRWWQLE